MEHPTITSIKKVIDDVEGLKEVAHNRLDAGFDPWHRKARSVLMQYAPVKIPAFDEIRFASDFFLSKTGKDKETINDRIALACDLDLAVEVLQQAVILVEDKIRQETVRGRMAPQEESLKPDSGLPGKPPSRTEEPVPVKSVSTGSWQQCILDMDLTADEQAELNQELDRLTRLLNDSDPEWDRVKRSIKFFLDFDRKLALHILPDILQSYTHRTAFPPAPE